MKVVAACSWFSEDPEDLRRMIEITTDVPVGFGR